MKLRQRSTLPVHQFTNFDRTAAAAAEVEQVKVKSNGKLAKNEAPQSTKANWPTRNIQPTHSRGLHSTHTHMLSYVCAYIYAPMSSGTLNTGAQIWGALIAFGSLVEMKEAQLLPPLFRLSICICICICICVCILGLIATIDKSLTELCQLIVDFLTYASIKLQKFWPLKPKTEESITNNG